MKNIAKNIIVSLRALLVLTILTGIVYPLLITLVGQALWSREANGSLVEFNGKTVGSELLAQKNTDAKYFWPRPSGGDFATVASGASQLSPTSENLRKLVEERKILFANPKLPADLLTASGSGLDPHISPEAARVQVSRIVASRGWSAEAVPMIHGLIDESIQGADFGFLGLTRVNVLLLNLRLDDMALTVNK